MKDLRVLVVEDELLVGLDIVCELQGAGFAFVEYAATEDEALHRIQKESWDVVVADANLNGRNIEQIVRLVKEKTLPFVVVSGYERHSLPAVVGDAPVLSKPVRSVQLIETVKHLCKVG